MKLITLTFFLAGPVLAANNMGGAGSLNQQPTLPPVTNPAAPAPAGPAAGPETAVRRGPPTNAETELQRSTATEVVFSAGDAALTPESQSRLDSLIQSARRRGQIEQVKVLSWGDISYPAAGKRSAPKGQKDLARDRGETIEAYLESRSSGLDVDTYNMVERPSALEDLLNSGEARVKNAMENSGFASSATNRGSKAVVMVIVR